MQHRKPDPLAEDIARDPRVLMAARLSNRLEIPTWIVIFSVYGAWLTLTLYFHAMPWYVMALAAPLVIAWQGSLRHEATHGHPINRTVATIVGYPPLGLLDAFPLYRKTHIAHHRNEYLTDPDADPESYYIRRDTWERMSRPMRALMLANQTFVGRMVLGPLIGYGRYYAYEIRSLLRGDFSHVRIWAEHLLLVGVVMYYVTQVCGISAVEYLLYFVYPGASVGMIRSFYEHRYDESPLARCVVVEKTPFFQLLFLNNNFHAVHHDKPGLPWYMLDGYYAERKEYYQAMNMSYRVEGYAALMWHYLFRPIFHPVHPFEATPQELALESRVDEVLDAASEVVKPLDDDTKIA
jgi:fatty acid desaturase